MMITVDGFLMKYLREIVAEDVRFYSLGGMETDVLNRRNFISSNQSDIKIMVVI